MSLSGFLPRRRRKRGEAKANRTTRPSLSFSTVISTTCVRTRIGDEARIGVDPKKADLCLSLNRSDEEYTAGRDGIVPNRCLERREIRTLCTSFRSLSLRPTPH